MNGETKARIALVGPVLPCRGGIAQYTTLLHRTLSMRADVLTVSPKRPYPRWIYPGQDVLEPGQEDHREDGVHYGLSALNILSWLRVARLLRSYKPTGVVIAWWTVFWAPSLGFIASRLEAVGIRVCFLCHNVADHEEARWKTFLTRLVLRNRRAFLVHTKPDAQRLSAWLPKSRVTVHPHPLYDHLPEPQSIPERRATLELLYFGFVRPYKGVDLLVGAMERIRRQPEMDVFLTIAGEFWIDDKELRERCDRCGNVEIMNRYIPDTEAAGLFYRADAVVLPYRSASGTGIIPLAYHYGKPVVVTAVGGLPEVVEDGKTGIVVPPDSVEAIAAAITTLASGTFRPDRTAFARQIRRMSWDGLAQALLDLLRDGETHP